VLLQAFRVAVVLSLLTSPASATLLVYEPFDYVAGTTLTAPMTAGGLNLTGMWSAPVGPFQQLFVAEPGLDYGTLAGLPVPAGNRLSQVNGVTGSATAAVDADVLVPADTAIYWSALLTLDDTGNENRFANITFADGTTGDLIGFGESVVGVRAIRVDAQTVGTGGTLVASGPDLAFTNGETVLLVGRYLNSAAPQGDRLDLLVYDTDDAEAIAGAFDLLDPAAEHVISLLGRDIDLARIDAIQFEIRGTNNNWIDELRIGTTYADVVPEPHTVVLVAAGLAGLTAAGRRRANEERGSGARGVVPSAFGHGPPRSLRRARSLRLVRDAREPARRAP
jgi:hypothetical protein